MNKWTFNLLEIQNGAGTGAHAHKDGAICSTQN